MNVRDMFNLKGQVAIVTGGGRGIGVKMAEGLAEAGANLVLCSRKKETCEKTAWDLAKLGVKTLALGCDVRSPGEIQAAVDETLREFGRLDILVNNSGTNWGATPEGVSPGGWQKVMETNLNGVFLFSQIAGRAMIRQKGGRIINVASIMGVVGTEGEVAEAIAYSAARGGDHFYEDLAAKWARI